jgi:putative tryptophan/tyrosine transport system substrate-binding protein
MKRREALTLLGGAVVAWPLGARAQQRDRLRRVAIVMQYVETDTQGQLRAAAFRNRWAENRFERLPELAADLARRRLAVITVGGASPTFAAKTATSTIPLVFIMGDDPIDLGLVASLARPGGNLTGISILTTEMTAKRLELLRELLPKVARVAVLANPASAATTEAVMHPFEITHIQGVPVICGRRECAEGLRPADQIRSVWCRTHCTLPRAPFRVHRQARARTAR